MVWYADTRHIVEWTALHYTLTVETNTYFVDVQLYDGYHNDHYGRDIPR